MTKPNSKPPMRMFLESSPFPGGALRFSYHRQLGFFPEPVDDYWEQCGHCEGKGYFKGYAGPRLGTFTCSRCLGSGKRKRESTDAIG